VQLIVMGDRSGPAGAELGAELWRVPFKGWGREHHLRATTWCIPRRWLVSPQTGDGITVAGRCTPLNLHPDDPFRLTVPSPSHGDATPRALRQ
jgi:hypothetical protein